MVMAPVTQTSSRANKTDSWRIQTPHIDYSSCIRCMICWKFCPDDALGISDSPDLMSPNERISRLKAPVIDLEHCKGCGICAFECPVNSIEMSIDGGLTS